MGESRRRQLLTATRQTSAMIGVTDGLWSLSNTTAQHELENWFTQRGMEPSMPGLHDTLAFLQAEQRDSRALNQVARLVEARSYTADELGEAERKIRVAAQAIANRVARDQRQGLCVVASGVLSRMLDELGVWNYTAKSNLTIHFPRSVSPEPRYFYSIDHGQFAAPHAIVVAPPFAVVDVTVKHQFYDEDAMRHWLPSTVMAKETRPYQVTSMELVSPSVRAELLKHGMTVERYLAQEKSDMLELMRHLPSREVTLEGGRLAYGVVAVGGYQERLRDLHGANCSIDGLTPIEIYERDVLPKL